MLLSFKILLTCTPICTWEQQTTPNHLVQKCLWVALESDVLLLFYQPMGVLSCAIHPPPFRSTCGRFTFELQTLFWPKCQVAGISARAPRISGCREHASECCGAQTRLHRSPSDSWYGPHARGNRVSRKVDMSRPVPSRPPRANG